MTAEEIMARKAEIRSEVEVEGADLNALEEEVRSLNAELNNIEAEAEKRKAIREAVAAGDGEIIAKMEERKMENEKIYTVESEEYRTGFLKDMLGMEMTAEERTAVDFVATTTDATYGSGNVLPRTMVDRIWDLIEEQHSIMGDVTIYRTGTILEVAKRTAISQGDAAIVNEATANDDEINTFVKVTLAGKDFSKHVDISYAMAKMSMDAFEQFLTNEIADRIGAAIADDVVDQIMDDYDDTNNAITTAAAGAIAWTDVTAAFATLKGAKRKVVYASEATIYGFIAAMVDDNGRPIFQPNANDGLEGYLLGAAVKVEDAVPANTVLIGDASNVVYNMVQDVMVESDRDIKKHVITYSGYARGEGALLVPKSFATITVQ